MSSSFFKEPPQKTTVSASAPVTKSRTVPVLVIIAVALIYGYCAYLLGHALNVKGVTPITMIGIYAYGLMGAVAILFCKKL